MRSTRHPPASRFEKFSVNSHEPHSFAPTSIHNHISLTELGDNLSESQHREAEVGGSQVRGLPGLHSNSLSQKTRKQTKNQSNKTPNPRNAVGQLIGYTRERRLQTQFKVNRTNQQPHVFMCVWYTCGGTQAHKWACGGQRSTLALISQEPSILICLLTQGPSR